LGRSYVCQLHRMSNCPLARAMRCALPVFIPVNTAMLSVSLSRSCIVSKWLNIIIYFLQPGSPIILVLPVFRLSDMRLGHALVFFLRGHRTAANTRAGSTQVHRSSGVPHSSDEVPPVRRVRRRRRHRLLPPPSRLSDVDE